MAKELPYFKFEPNQWDHGNIQMCSRDDKGLFMDLCSMYWSRLGDVPFKLAVQKLCAGNATAFDSLISEGIFQVIDDSIYIEFLNEQLQEFEIISSQNRQNALDGWKKRRKKSDRNATALNPQSESDAIREEKKREEKNRESVIFPFTSDDFKRLWSLWKEYRKDQHNFKYKSSSTEQAALTSLTNITQDEQTAIQVIKQSIANGWKGFFELKNKNNGRQKEQDYADFIQQQYPDYDL